MKERDTGWEDKYTVCGNKKIETMVHLLLTCRRSEDQRKCFFEKVNAVDKKLKNPHKIKIILRFSETSEFRNIVELYI